MSLSADRNTPLRAGEIFEYPVKASTKIYAGGLVALSSGYAQPGAEATGLIAVGRAEEQVDNSGGGNGAATVRVRRGVFRFNNSASGDAITRSEIGQACYVVDDATVAKTSDGGSRSPAGFVVDVDDQGVWVLVGYGPVSAPDGALAAANNLSDVANAATARGNLGANKIYLPVHIPDLRGSEAAVHRIVAPVAGAITKIWSVLNGALATGNATLTGKVGATAITNGVVTIAESGSAAGDVDSAEPSANNAVTAGAVISLTVGGGNTAEVSADALIEITF